MDEVGKINIAPNIFNGAAIILLLVGLPLVVAGITTYSVPSIENENVETKDALIAGFWGPNSYGSAMMSNGADMYSKYLNLDQTSPSYHYDCVNVIPFRELVPNTNASNPYYFLGVCEHATSVAGYPISSSVAAHNIAVYNNQSDSVVAFMPKTGFAGYSASSAPNYPGFQGSGDGNFEWSFINQIHQNTGNYAVPIRAFEFDTDDPIRSIHMEMDEQMNYYPCDDYRFGEVKIKHTIEFVNGDNETLKIDDIFETITQNRVSVPNQGNGICSKYLKMDYEFDGVQIMDIHDFVDDDYRNVSVIVKIVKIERTDGAPFGDTHLPFVGDDVAYYHSFTYTTIEASEINLYMKGITGVVGIGLCYLALANTRFYNPVFGYMKEALKKENVNRSTGKISMNSKPMLRGVNR